MSRRFPALIALSAAVLMAGCAVPALSQHDASMARATVDFASCGKPKYPQEALDAKREGAVVLAYLVGADGRASDSKVAKSSGHADLDETAREAIGKCRFNPAMRDAKPVAGWMSVTYVWVLK